MPNLSKNPTSLNVILIKSMKKGDEWLTNYGKDFWLKKSNFDSLDTKTKKVCREFYKFQNQDVYDDDANSSTEEEKDEDEQAEDSGSGDNGSDSSTGSDEDEGEEDA